MSETNGAATVLAEAGDFLTGVPVEHNGMLTLLTDRSQTGQPGRYWIVSHDGPVGVALHSPPSAPVMITAMAPEAVVALVEAIGASDTQLPGVVGDAATAARFAGGWTERRDTFAVPEIGMRLHEIHHVRPPNGVAGRLRLASLDERDLLVAWVTAFSVDIGESTTGTEEIVDRRLAAGHFWTWDDRGPVSIAALTPEIASVRRVQAVYTPPACRGRGYAAASVAQLSQHILDLGQRAILYTDLGNPIPSRIYRRLGYQAIGETMRYRFGDSQQRSRS